MSLLGYVKRLIGQGSELPEDTVIIPPLVEAHDLEDPVHDGANLAEIVRNQAPPVELGIPVLTLEQLLVTQKELIEQLQTIGEIDIEQFRSLIMPLIERFASFVHLLPASENYHHHGTGGLLNHSLDVALRSGKIISSKYLQRQGASPSENNAVKKRWPYVAMVAGLCHDLAKPFSDFEVTDMSRKIIWDPFSESLLEWAQRHKLKRYRYTWKKNRYGKHEQIAGGLLHQVLTPTFISWLRDAGSTVTYPLFQVIAYGSAAPNINPLRSVVLEADQRSTITDVHRWQEARKEIGMKVKMERYMLNIIKEQILSGEWTVNEDDSIVLVVEGDVFLDWREASAFLIYKLEELELTGLPNTGTAIADLLINADIAMRNLSNPNRPRRFWDILIPIATKDGMGIDIRKEALRFVSPDYVLDRIYESRPGARILKTSESETPDTPVRESKTQEDTSVKEDSATNNTDHDVAPAPDERAPVNEPLVDGDDNPLDIDRPKNTADLNDDGYGDDVVARHANTGSSGVTASHKRKKGHEKPADQNLGEKKRSRSASKVLNSESKTAQHSTEQGVWHAGHPTSKKTSVVKAPEETGSPGSSKHKTHSAGTGRKTKDTSNPFSGPPAERPSRIRQKVDGVDGANNSKPVVENEQSHPAHQRDDLVKSLVKGLSSANRLDNRIRLEEDGTLYLLFPDGFLGEKKPSILKKLFVKEGIVRRTDSEIDYILNPNLAEEFLPLITRQNNNG